MERNEQEYVLYKILLELKEIKEALQLIAIVVHAYGKITLGEKLKEVFKDENPGNKD